MFFRTRDSLVSGGVQLSHSRGKLTQPSSTGLGQVKPSSTLKLPKTIRKEKSSTSNSALYSEVDLQTSPQYHPFQPTVHLLSYFNPQDTSFLAILSLPLK